MTNGSRIRQVRELRGWSQEELAYRVGIKQPTLAQIEAGTDKASEKVIAAISSVTDFLPGFFERPDIVEFPLGSLLFRAHSSITSRQRTEAFRHAQLLFELWEELAVTVNELPVHLPSIRQEPVLAAQIARAQLGVSPDTPIPYLINLAEKNGAVVLAIPTPLEKRDAFSLWAGAGLRKPVIALSAGAPGDRTNWSVAHELAHLAMHHPIRAFTGDGDLEDQANAFAAEFLLPESAMHREIAEPLTMEKLVALKSRWKVAIQALIRRARDIGKITDRSYRYLFERLIANGWKINEPNPIPAEKPRALREMAELVYGEPLNYARMSNDIFIGISRLREVFGAHAQHSGETRPVDPPAKRNNLVRLPSNRFTVVDQAATRKVN